MKKTPLISSIALIFTLGAYAWEGNGYKILSHYSYVSGVKRSWIKEIHSPKDRAFTEDGRCKKNLPKNVGCKSTLDDAEKITKK